MISIIISFSNPEYLSAVKKNIDETVGIPYEILAVPNGDGKRGICEVYNAAGALAKYDVLCFMHEDVILHTPDWGKKVVEIMNDPEIGLLGVAGSKYKSLIPCGWSCPGITTPWHKANFIQRFKFADIPTQHFVYNTDAEDLSEVATLDGVWMCTKKGVFNAFKFDERLLTGFHGYDLDYALQVGKTY
jgi:glycosyltransferase involved in cell wall biosynthesis